MLSNEYQKYFNTLNYTLANEDTSLEYGILPHGSNHVVSVAGSGSRILPLLAKAPRQLTCIDVSESQLYLTELRILSVCELSHTEFLAFWGYPPKEQTAKERERAFRFIQQKLSPKALEYLENYFIYNKWKSILYKGRWETTFSKLAKYNRWLTGNAGLAIFHSLSQEEQNEYLRTKFPEAWWKLTLTLLGSATVFNQLLYRGSFPKKNIPDSSFQHYHKAFQRLFYQDLARKNFFLQLIFFGKVIFSEGLPAEADAQIFRDAKESLNKNLTEITYCLTSVFEKVKTFSSPHDQVSFLSLSDVPSYLSGANEKTYLFGLSEGMAVGGLIVIRNYLRLHQNRDLSQYEDVSNQYTQLIEAEKTQVYHVEIFKKKGNPSS